MGARALGRASRRRGRRHETGATLVGEEKDLWPNKRFVLTVVVTSPEFLVRHPDVVKKFLAVHADWSERLAIEPQAYARQLDDALAALSGKKLKPGVTAGAMKNVEFTLDPLPDTFSTMGQWAADLRTPADAALLVNPSPSRGGRSGRRTWAWRRHRRT